MVDVTQVRTGHVGSVIEASIVRFVAQSTELNETPPLGSLLRIEDHGVVIYGIVSGAVTESIDPGRRPYIREGTPLDADAYLRENPHLAYLYRTAFTAVVVGHRDGGPLCHYLPPAPARLYAAVFTCEEDEVGGFCGPSPWSRMDFLPLLLAGAGSDTADDVVAAFLRRSARTTMDPRAYLVAAGKTVSVLLANDPARLNGILRRIRL